MRTGAWAVLAAALAIAAGCDSGNPSLVGTPDGADADAVGDGVEDPGADADADSPAEADAEAGADADSPAEADAEADADAEVACLASCANDPTDGPVGTACDETTPCSDGLDCLPETIAVFDGEAYVSYPGGYCASWGTGACDPTDPRSCPTGATCIYFGRGPTGDSYGCLDRCAVASRMGEPWNDNCDCRDGYTCDLGSELCLSGCSNDRECCEIWDDLNGNGLRNVGEVTVLDSSRCTDTCDPCTFSCTLEGCPGGGCAIGDPCVHDSDCPAQAQCWSEADAGADVVPGGLCTLQRCDLVGRECPTGAGCANLGNSWEPDYVCMVPCTPGTVPGDADYACRDADPPGPSAGDYACVPTDSTTWFDTTSAEGYCWAGSFPGGTETLGSPCTASSECASPFGLGYCADWAGDGWCSSSCSQTLAADGICEVDPASTTATGACYYSICLAACDTPDGPLGANGCANPDLACYAARTFGTYLYVADGRTRPAGVCYFACTDDTWCADNWDPRTTCDEATGICG